MLRKKNYKDEDHFSQYYSAFLPRHRSHKLTFYYKRYRPTPKHPSLYGLLHQTQQPKQDQSQSPFPVDRTLELISFDGPLEAVRGYLRKVGRIRKMTTGQTQYK